MTVTKLLLDIEVFYQLTILSCSPALLSWSSSSSVLIFLQFRPAILALQLFGIKLIPGRPGLTLLAFLAYSSSSSSNFSSSAVCNSAIYRIYRALWACFKCSVNWGLWHLWGILALHHPSSGRYTYSNPVQTNFPEKENTLTLETQKLVGRHMDLWRR